MENNTYCILYYCEFVISIEPIACNDNVDDILYVTALI